MKYWLSTLLCVFLTVSVAAQQRAVTATGDEVILYDDGTWRYQDESINTKKEIPTNPKKFKKPENSTFLLKSNNVNVGIWLNPKDWTFEKSEEGNAAEYDLRLKGGNIFGNIITEQLDVPLESLKAIALENARSAAPDIRVIKEEYRNVNGLDVLMMQMKGTIQGIKFYYYAYYFVGESKAVQFLTYTSQPLSDTVADACEKLLNGLVELNEKE